MLVYIRLILLMPHLSKHIMQSSLIIKLSKEQLDSLADNTIDTAAVLTEVITAKAEQIGYMLQEYHPGEKASQVTITEGSLQVKDAESAVLQVRYVIEQFSSCIIIDSVGNEKMNIIADIDLEKEELNLKGEFWPSLND